MSAQLPSPGSIRVLHVITRMVRGGAQERLDHRRLSVGRPEQWSIIHSGVDFRPLEAARGARAAVRAGLGLPPEAKVLGTVGRLVPVKGHADLIEALARLGTRHPGL